MSPLKTTELSLLLKVKLNFLHLAAFLTCCGGVVINLGEPADVYNPRRAVLI